MTAATPAIAGCSAFGADHASYWSESRQIDVDYDDVLRVARDTSYTVEEPYYVGVTEPRGIHPEGFAAFDERFGPAYRVFGFTFLPVESVLVEFWLTGETPTVTLIDDRGFDEFPVESFPSERWLVDRFTVAFDISESSARAYVDDLRGTVAEGTSNPSIEVDARVTIQRVYEAIDAERTDWSGSDTGGDGWYKETSFRDGSRFATIDIIVQSMAISHADDDRTYTLKLDRLGGFYLRIELPAGETIPEREYREVFRTMFENVGLPPESIEDLTFEYAASVW